MDSGRTMVGVWGGGLPPLTVKNRSRTTTFYCPCAVSQSHRGTEVAPPREAGRPV